MPAPVSIRQSYSEAPDRLHEAVDLTILVPALNEEGNICRLAPAFAPLLESQDFSYELFIVDDGSTDNTVNEAHEASAKYPWVRWVSHRRNLGKTEVILTGLAEARGRVFVVFDADLQFCPEDAIAFFHKIREGYDIVTGWKQGAYQKPFVSGVYNRLCRILFGVTVHDLNSMKAFRREVLDGIPLRKDWHRYMVVLAAAQGYRVAEMKIELQPRTVGVSKYTGGWRIIVGLMDLVAVWVQLVLLRKPMLMLGTPGLFLVAAGVATGMIAIYWRVFENFGFRPMLYLTMLLVLAGLLLFVLGVAAEGIALMKGQLDVVRSEVRALRDEIATSRRDEHHDG